MLLGFSRLFGRGGHTDRRLPSDERERAVSWVCDWCEEIGGGCSQSLAAVCDCEMVRYLGEVSDGRC